MEKVADGERIYGAHPMLTEDGDYMIKEGEEIRGFCKCFLEEFYGDLLVVQQQELQSFLSLRRDLSIRLVTSVLHQLKVDLAYAYPMRFPLSPTDIETAKRHLVARYQVQDLINDSFSTTLKELLAPMRTEVLRLWSLRQLIESGSVRKSSGEHMAFLAEISSYLDLLSPKAIESALALEIGERITSRWELRTAITNILGAALPSLQPSFMDKVMEYPFDFLEPIPIGTVQEAIQKAIDGTLQDVFQLLLTANQEPASPSSDTSSPPAKRKTPSTKHKTKVLLFSSNIIRERRMNEIIQSIARCYLAKRREDPKAVVAEKPEEEEETYDYGELEKEALRITARAAFAQAQAESLPAQLKDRRINQEGLLNLFNSALVQDEKVAKVRERLNRSKHPDDEEILQMMNCKEQKKGKKKLPISTVEPVFTPGLALRGERLAQPKPLDKHCCSCDCTLC